MELHQLAFWTAVLKVISVDLLLSGDNAVVIALACRELAPSQRRWGMIFGAALAALLLIAFASIAAQLMTLPYLKIVGGAALVFIAVRLLVPPANGHSHIEAADDLWRAIRIVALADVVMSFDNVIAVTAAAEGNIYLLALALSISIPVVIAGSALVIAVLERFPLLVWAGAALLGWIAGELFASDPFIDRHLADLGDWVPGTIGLALRTAGAAAVVASAMILRSRVGPASDEVESS